MKYLIFISLLSLSFVVFSQEKIVKTIESDAPYVEFKTIGIDHLIIEESKAEKLELILINTDLGILEDVSCNDYNCVLSIATSLKEINKLSTTKTSETKVILKIPKNKKVTVFGATINIQINGYEGILRSFIKNGKIEVKEIKGITEIEIVSGTVLATINDASVNVRTKKGTITLNNKKIKSTFKKQQNKTQRLIVKSRKANIVLSQL